MNLFQDELNEIPTSAEIDIKLRLSNLLGKISNVSADGSLGSSVCERCSVVISDLITFRKSGANKTSIIEYLTDLCVSIIGYIPSVCKTFSEIETVSYSTVYHYNYSFFENIPN